MTNTTMNLPVNHPFPDQAIAICRVYQDTTWLEKQ